MNSTRLINLEDQQWFELYLTESYNSWRCGILIQIFLEASSTGLIFPICFPPNGPWILQVQCMNLVVLVRHVEHCRMPVNSLFDLMFSCG